MEGREMPSASRHGSGSSKLTLYKVEVRSTSHSPTVIDENFVIDGVWRTIPIGRSDGTFGANIPVGLLEREGLDIGLVGYEAAEAHRWAFVAYLNAARPGGSLCIETRLVGVEFKTRYETAEIGVSQVSVHRSRPELSTRREPASQTDE